MSSYLKKLKQLETKAKEEHFPFTFTFIVIDGEEPQIESKHDKHYVYYIEAV